jgi:hypothetical protein
LLNHPTLNERWLQERIADDPSILGLDGEIRLLDRERNLQGGGRLDLLLLDDDNSRRYEVEIQLGATNPSHIIRCIEYWDIERRRYPGYEHIAVLVAEQVTTRFLNVMSLMSGSIPLMALQLDALRVGDKLLLNFSRVLDQTELRIDDTDDDGGGPAADRAYWEKKAGGPLMKLCDSILAIINEHATTKCDLNYLRGSIGLQSKGVVNNFIYMSPKPTKQFTHVTFRIGDTTPWLPRFEEAGIPVASKRKGRFRISVSPAQFAENRPLMTETITAAVKEFEE